MGIHAFCSMKLIKFSTVAFVIYMGVLHVH
jgi:hypothetical protein